MTDTSPLMSQMTPAERRYKARKIRALCQVGDRPKTMTEAADIQGVSRTWAYRILEELHTWEDKATFKQEIADIDTQLRRLGSSWAACDGTKWFLTSGKLTIAYAKGELPLELETQGSAEDISDPLME